MKEYFDEKTKVKSKFTVNSESNPVFYEYSIEHNKPMLWSVSTETSVIETVKNMPDDKYSICVNKNGYLFKKLNFSKYHTRYNINGNLNNINNVNNIKGYYRCDFCVNDTFQLKCLFQKKKQ